MENREQLIARGLKIIALGFPSFDVNAWPVFFTETDEYWEVTFESDGQSLVSFPFVRFRKSDESILMVGRYQ